MRGKFCIMKFLLIKIFFFFHIQIFPDFDLEKLITYNDTEPIIDYNIDFPLIPDLPLIKLENQEGVFNVSLEPDKNTNKVPSVFEFIKDLAFIIEQTHNVSNKTLAHNRLEILENKFKMHLSFNREKETLQLQAISHRDFYNVRKVDTHIHHSACMRAKQLLEFIINKIKVLINIVLRVLLKSFVFKF